LPAIPVDGRALLRTAFCYAFPKESRENQASGYGGYV